MSAITVEELKKLSETAEREQREERDSASTFLEIIGRSRRETYVSSLLAYVIRKDDGLLTKLLQYALKDSAPEIAKNMPEIADKDVTCEAAMSGGRADIFVTGKFKGGAAFTLTIENKVDSWEHGGQTTVYYNYVTKHYEGHNAFIYLKPDDSQSTPECSDFKSLTYSCLNGMITGGTDRITDDFKRHIDNNFSGKKTMNDTTLEVLKNYTEYKKIFDEAKAQSDKLQKDILAQVKDGYVTENSGDSHRLYKGEWYRKDTLKYYFYAELVCENDDPSYIYVQSTVKVYSRDTDNPLFTFCENLKAKTDGSFWFDDNFFIFHKEKIESSEEFFSDSWIEKIREKAEKEMKNALFITESRFNEYMTYLKDIEENKTEN